MSDPDYKVVVLAAGRGTRLMEISQDINKALLPIGHQAIISRILEKFPVDIEIVMAVGYEQEKLKDYLDIAHPERTIRYVSIDRITEAGSGPGYSLLQCREYVKGPFIFTTVDTLVTEKIPAVDHNWFGVAPAADTAKYNTVSIKNGLVTDMVDKVASDNTHAFIGLAGVKDYEIFWQALEQGSALVQGEMQVSGGFAALIPYGLHAKEFTWYDTGDVEGYTRAARDLAHGEDSFDFSKKGEFLYFANEKVIKYFSDPMVVANRVARAKQMKSSVPKISDVKRNFYAYKKIPGQTFYEINQPSLVLELLVWLRSNLWKKLELDDSGREKFKQACWRFYHDKTYQRLEMYYQQAGDETKAVHVSGRQVPRLAELLEKVDWEWLSEGIPSPLHGDLQFDNILVRNDGASRFALLDWRQDFAGLLEYGDLYYDLAKLNGGMIIPYNLIKKNVFSFEGDGNEVRISIPSSPELVRSHKFFKEFIKQAGYDQKKIDVLTALIFLNMSPLHTHPFNQLLYHQGRLELARALDYEQARA